MTRDEIVAVALRALARDLAALATLALDDCPSTRERTLLLTGIEESIQRAHSAIVRQNVGSELKKPTIYRCEVCDEELPDAMLCGICAAEEE